MAGTMEVEGPTRLERGPMLRPMTARLLNALSQQAQQEGSVTIGIKQYSVEVTAWERGAVLELRDRGLRDTTHWSFRLLEALAVQAKGYADLYRLQSGELSDEQKERCRQELVADYGLGRAIENELGAAIEVLDASERKGPAKNLNATRLRLRDSLRQFESVLAEPELQRATQLTAEFFVPLDDLLTRAVSPDSDAAGPSGPTQLPASSTSVPASSMTRAGRLASQRIPQDRSRLHLALIGLGAFLLFSLVTFLILLAGQRYDVEDAFARTPGVRGMTGEPPRATVTVSAETWKGLDRPGRTRLVSAIGAAVRRAGYSSAVIATPDKKAVAEWIDNQGSKVY